MCPVPARAAVAARLLLAYRACLTKTPYEEHGNPGSAKRAATATTEAVGQYDMLIEGGMPLPWWEFSSADFAPPGSIAQPDSDADEALLRGFLRAGALAETAARFLSANSLKVVGVLETLGRDELVLPTPEQLDANRYLPQYRGTEATDSGHAVLGCRSRLYGLPLADRHAALNAVCSFRHRLPRRALVNFVCRLILGKDVAQLKEGQRQHHHHHHHTVGGERNGAHGSDGNCSCGERPLAAKTQRGETGTPKNPASEAAANSTSCRSCLARRGWIDLFSARMLSVACRKMLWDRTLPDDETLALNRCLSALSEIIGNPPQETAWPDSSWERGSSRSTGGGGFSPSYPLLPASERVVAGAPQDRTTTAPTRWPTSQTGPPRGVGTSEADAGPCQRLPPAAVGVASLLAGVRRRQLGSNALAGDHEGGPASAGHHRRGSTHSADKRPRSAVDESRTGGAGPPAKKAARAYPDLARQSESTVHPAKGGRVSVDDEESAKASTHRPVKSVSDNIDMVGGGPVPEAAEVAVVGPNAAATAVVVDGKRAGLPAPSATEQPEDCLASEIREQMKSVVEKLVAAGARGATSADVQGAATATVSLLQAAVSPSALSTHRSASFQEQQQQQPLKIVCKGLGLDVSRGKGASGCGDDLVMAVCTGFVTQALSLKNCLAFVEAVLVPRARSLSSPASRLLVTTVSGVGKTRPEVVIDGLIRPLLCEGNQSEVGSAQCELCTRLIKQILPKHTLEAVLVALCGMRAAEGVGAGGWGGGPSGGGDRSNPGQVAGSCVWTELTMPVITAAVNLKPPLSERAIGVVIRRVEAAAELPQLQKSLKFTTLVHGLVTRYGPQLKPFVPALRAAVGRCSTFMVKAVLAALQRLEK